MKDRRSNLNERDVTAFQNAALKGGVVNKDRVAIILKKLPLLYEELGVDKKSSSRVVANLEQKFYGGDRTIQVTVGSQIIYIYDL
ncbi:hypothetical protein HYS11_00700 [Candidatus Gottesmanbacteria bacterium]|nr:hypothetical protein [Candidatus Gottesmanbacteria bacterium]